MKLSNIQKRLKKYAKRILKLILFIKEHKYNFSPVFENPDFLFLGINPGSGFFKHNGIKVKKYSPLEKSEYETEEYNLQSEWKYVFGEKEKINNLPLLYNSPKINFSF